MGKRPLSLHPLDPVAAAIRHRKEMHRVPTKCDARDSSLKHPVTYPSGLLNTSQSDSVEQFLLMQRRYLSMGRYDDEEKVDIPGLEGYGKIYLR